MQGRRVPCYALASRRGRRGCHGRPPAARHAVAARYGPMKCRHWEAYARDTIRTVLDRGPPARSGRGLTPTPAGHWLDALLEEAELLAPEAWDPQEDERVQECCAGLLGAVLVVLMEQRGHPDQLEVAVSTLMSHLHCYMLALAAERVSRDTEIWLEPPTLANLFDEAREVQARRRAAEDS